MNGWSLTYGHPDPGREGKYAAPGDEKPAQKRHALRPFFGRCCADDRRVAVSERRRAARAVVPRCLVVCEARGLLERSSCDGTTRAGKDDLGIHNFTGEMRGQQSRAAQLLADGKGKGLRVEELAEAPRSRCLLARCD